MTVNGPERSTGEPRNLADHQRQIILGRLAPIIVHEFNNLMTPVLARAQDALTRDDAVATRKALSVTVQQTDRAMRFARRVLELAGDDGPAAENRSLRELIEASIESMVRPLEKDGVELRVDVPDDPRIAARPLLFVQMMLNLLMNARAAMAGGRGRISISAARDGGVVIIDVGDTGVGMSPEMLRDVINPFLAADPDANAGDWRSVGLGLHVCRLVARQHGASIRALRNEDSGCTFKITWPAA